MRLTCPACRNVLLKPQKDPDTGLVIDSCPKCRGLWFDGKEISVFFQSDTLKKKFFKKKESGSSQGKDPSSDRFCKKCFRKLKKWVHGDTITYVCMNCQAEYPGDIPLSRLCPRCNAPMAEKPFGSVLIDICYQCEGVWLDEGEILEIASEYRKGRGEEEIVAEELSIGLSGGSDTPSLGDRLKAFLSIFKKQK